MPNVRGASQNFYGGSLTEHSAPSSSSIRNTPQPIPLSSGAGGGGGSGGGYAQFNTNSVGGSAFESGPYNPENTLNLIGVGNSASRSPAFFSSKSPYHPIETDRFIDQGVGNHPDSFGGPDSHEIFQDYTGNFDADEVYFNSGDITQRPFGGNPWSVGGPALPTTCTDLSCGAVGGNPKPGSSAGTVCGGAGGGCGVLPGYLPSTGKGPLQGPMTGQRAQLGGKPTTSSCYAGTSLYTVDDFKDVPIYFAGLMKHCFQMDELSLAFSSADTAYRIMREISRIVYDQHGVWIGKQDNRVLAQTMYSAYAGYRVRYKHGNLQKDVENLAALVLDNIVPRVLANYTQLVGYLPLIDRVAQPIPLPKNMSGRGLDGRSVYDVGRFLP